MYIYTSYFKVIYWKEKSLLGAKLKEKSAPNVSYCQNNCKRECVKRIENDLSKKGVLENKEKTPISEPTKFEKNLAENGNEKTSENIVQTVQTVQNSKHNIISREEPQFTEAAPVARV